MRRSSRAGWFTGERAFSLPGVTVLSMLLIGCEDGGAASPTGPASDETDPPTATAIGQVVLWTDNAELLPISVFVGGTRVGEITTASADVPGCGESGVITIEDEAGQRGFTATGRDIEWSGVVPIVAGACHSVRLSTAEVRLRVEGSGAGSGLVRSLPRGIDCVIEASAVPGSACTAAGPAGATRFVLTAHARDGSEFVGWAGACQGSEPVCAVELDADATVTAEFRVRSVTPPYPSSFTLRTRIEGAGGGAVYSTRPDGQVQCSQASGATVTTGNCSATYPPGTMVTLRAATEAVGTTFVGWGGACASAGRSGVCTVSITGDQVVTAEFTR